MIHHLLSCGMPVHSKCDLMDRGSCLERHSLLWNCILLDVRCPCFVFTEQSAAACVSPNCNHDGCLQVGFETEGTAIYDTMCYLKNEVRSRPP